MTEDHIAGERRLGKLTLPPLNAVRAFEAVARHLSFTRAADELCVTQGAVSRSILGLEDWLGHNLFIRKRTGIEMSREGEFYARGVRRSLEILSDHTSALTAAHKANSIRVSASPSLSMFWLVPRLASYRLHNPDTEIHLSFPPYYAGPAASTMSAADLSLDFIGRDTPPASNRYTRIPLFDEWITIVCHPTAIQGLPPPQKISDIPKYRLIRNAVRPRDWSDWIEHAGLGDSVLDNTLEVGNTTLALEAARQGLGLAIAMVPYVRGDLAQGTLVAPFAQQPYQTGNSYAVTLPAGGARGKAVKSFVGWLKEQGRIEQAENKSAER